MTLFYSKRSGDIKAYTTGEADFGYFGNDEEDMKVIYDCLIIDLDEFVLDNTDKFKITNGELKLSEEAIPEKYL